MAQRAVKITEEPDMIADEIGIIHEVESNPILALTDQAKFDAYFAAIEKQALAVPVDLESATGRDRIKSAAAQVARKKSPFENARKASTEEWRRLTAAVNAAGKVVTERLDDLRDRVRKPVTDWESAEDARRAEADLIIENLKSAAIVRADETSADVQTRLDRVRGHNLNSELFGPRIEMVTDLRDETVAALAAALERLKQVEADRAELERLREQAAAAEQAEAKRRADEEARAAEERRKADEEARLAEVERVARQNAEDAAAKAHEEELDRVARAKQAEIDAANERARKVQEEAEADRQRIQREHDEAIAAERAKAEKLEADAKAERDRIAAEEKRIADDKARLEADQAYRTKCKTEAKEDLIAIGIPEAKAIKIIQSAVAREIRHMPFVF